MSQSNLDSLLLGFRDDINSGDIDSARSKFEDIVDAYSSGDSQNEELELALQYRAADSQSIDTNDVETADDYLRSFLGAGASRTSVLLLGTVLISEYEDLQGTDEFDELKSELNDAIDDLVDAEDEIARTKTDTETIIKNANVPADVEILETSFTGDTATKGGSLDVDVLIKNVGDETANGVTVKIEGTTDGITGIPDPDTVGQLSGGQDYSGNYELSITDSGNDSESFNFVVESDNAGFDTSEVILPVDTSESPDAPSDFPGSDELFNSINQDEDNEITPAEMSQAVGEFLQNGTVDGNNVSPGEMSQVVGWFLGQ